MKVHGVSFIDYFIQQTGIKLKIIQKRKSVFMKVIAALIWLLNKLRIIGINREAFMSNYVTVIGSKIYGGPDWSSQMRVTSTLLHELVHILQFNKRGFIRTSLQYLFSKRRRCYFETSAEQVNMIAYKAYTDQYLVHLAAEYAKYGLPYDDVYKSLKARAYEVDGLPNFPADKNKVDAQPEPKVVANLYEHWKGVNGE